jgi:hypothetical protein
MTTMILKPPTLHVSSLGDGDFRVERVTQSDILLPDWFQRGYVATAAELCAVQRDYKCALVDVAPAPLA